MPKTIEEILHELENLPTLPKVFYKITTMIDNPRVSASDVSQEISTDPALTSKMLRRINSAFYGLPRQVSTVTHAIVLLGFSTVKSLILAMSLSEIFPSDENTAFDRRSFWIHSQGTAFMAKAIAKHIGSPKHEEMFVAGLLHDIGKIILDKYAHEDLIEVASLILQKDILFKDAEIETMKFTHSDLGAAVAERWNLPTILKECIEFHHQPEEAINFPRETAIVHLADILTRSKGIGSGGDRKIPQLSTHAWEILGLNFDNLEELLRVTEIPAQLALID